MSQPAASNATRPRDPFAAATAAAPAVDVVIPVYNALDDLARCLDSVLTHTPRTCRLVLIDDASPDPAVAAFFADVARRALPHVRLLRNPLNQGFTLTANRGMSLSSADVVLLNSDTVVTAGWLDALIRCAASDPSIGTVTPFSNNAEICSFPRFCEVNPWYGHEDMERTRAALAAAAVPTYPELPTGVGFCLYIRRALIDAIGAFDPVFGLGYGEENDFCMRAVEAGWRNVLCDDAFVAHIGGRSFEGRKGELGTRNMALLLERHPRYLDIVREYIAADPPHAIREAAQSRLRLATGPERGVLHVIHGHGGGTEHHVRALIDVSRGAYRHYLAIAVGDHWQIEEHQDEGNVRTFNFRRREGEPWRDFVGGLCATFRIGLVHLHNISGCRDGLIAAAATLPVPYGYTVHDLNFACPTITFLGTDGMYCGALTDVDACARCLAAQPDFAHVDIAAWRAMHREMVARTAFLVAPSRWAADTLSRYFPGRAIDVIPHGAPGVWATQESRAEAPGTDRRPARLAVVLPDDGLPTVAVLGAIGPDKGARRIERLVELVRAGGRDMRFVLIGYLDVEHGPWQSDDALFTIHGRYKPRDLPDLLAHYRVRLVAYPSAGPETFSFTLSEAWAAGRPVIVPPFGALAERLAGTGAGWAWSEDEWRDEARMLARMREVVAAAHAAGLAAASQAARACVQPTLAAMAERTLQLYAATMPNREATAADPPIRPLDAARVRDALGYVPWIAPRSLPVVSERATAEGTADAAGCATAPQPGVVPGLSRLALRLRHTLPGRILYRLTPKPVLDALKARIS